MPKKVKFVLLFLSVFAWLALISGNQVWSEDCGPIGNFAEAIFDEGNVKIVYDPCNGDISAVCKPVSSDPDPNDVCGNGWEPAPQTTLTIDPDGEGTEAARLISNVGPGTGCVCYVNPPYVIVRGKVYDLGLY